jgi:hypothetical protein
MSQENVEIVRTFSEAYEREDRDGWKELLAVRQSSSSLSGWCKTHMNLAACA